MRDLLIIMLNWREVAELLHDVGHGLCAVSDPHHVHADNHERNMRNRAVAIFNKRGLTMRAADGAFSLVRRVALLVTPRR